MGEFCFMHLSYGSEKGVPKTLSMIGKARMIMNDQSSKGEYITGETSKISSKYLFYPPDSEKMATNYPSIGPRVPSFCLNRPLSLL